MRDLIIGLTLLVLGAWGIIGWWDNFGEVLRGVVPLLLALVGLAAVGAGLKKTRGEAEEQDQRIGDANASAIDETPVL